MQETGSQPIHWAAAGGRNNIINMLVEMYHVDPQTKVVSHTYVILHLLP